MSSPSDPRPGRGAAVPPAPDLDLSAIVRSPLHAWRSSVSLRVVATTLALSLLVAGLVGWLLVGRITSGLLDAKERASVAEAASGAADAQRQLDAAYTGPQTRSASVIVDNLMSGLALRAGGSPRLYEVVLLASPPKRGDTPERATSDVAESSVPTELRTAVATDQRQSWTYTEIRFTDGTTMPGLVVGSPITLPSAGNPPMELYFLFPLTQEQTTLDLVRRTVLLVGIVLVITLGVIAYVVTRQVVSPVRQAARTAQRFSDGLLTERMRVRGEDDLAKLATSFNAMAGNLQEQITRLEALSRVQQRFVSDVSHELRTPLTTVRMAADMLYEGRDEFDAATARSAELLQNQLDRFESLLADLLEISRFDAGAAVLDPDPVDLRAMVERVVESAAPLAERKQTEVVVAAPDGPCIAEVDARRIDRVLRNLVMNAIEHGEGRPVDITIGGNEEAVAVTVRDHGVGLRPGESSLVFNRFWRADPARARTIGGTGLGLSIALEDARLHGGWLQAWGAPGDGASFRLTLPRTVHGSMSESPLPLEPTDAGPRVQASLASPYAGPRREEAAK
ncbi:MAG TPA: MtrAB system histidine kinase MtrB [Candidatus Nanopelagicales bacterium]|nr:MtrAB system histidine kinase MtrB [Candidatus Nanopelagicales bacterium]